MTNSPILNFAIVGAMKSGTSSLHKLLASHSQVSLPRIKETNFFIAERNLAKGFDWYWAQFDDTTKILGEASPNYSKKHVFSEVPYRLHRHNPDLKIIYIVRDPIKRASSHYSHVVLRGLMREQEFLPGRSGYSNILNTSRYFSQIEEFRKFFCEDNIHILDFSELAQNLESVKFQLKEIIGLEDDFPSAGRVHQNATQATAQQSELYMRIARSSLYQKFRKNAFLSRFYRSLPQKAHSQLRNLKSRSQPRRLPKLPDVTIESLRRDLHSDVTRFRDFAGRDFSDWVL